METLPVAPSGTEESLDVLAETTDQIEPGCGPKLKDSWVNIDLFDPRADLHLDLRGAWPFPNGGISYIYSEHAFEHFDFHVEVPHFLAQAVRVLEAGGVFDLVVPDAEWPLKSSGDPSATHWTTSAKRWHPGWCQTQLDQINYHFRQNGEHKYAWDAETLARTIKAAGFQFVVLLEFNSTMDSEERRLGSL